MKSLTRLLLLPIIISVTGIFALCVTFSLILTHEPKLIEIFLIHCLILIGLLWAIVQCTLKPIRALGRAIQQRSPKVLTPIELTHIPLELRPIIKITNVLLTRLEEGLNRETRLISDAAHELKTPLAAVNTYTQIALSSNDPNMQKDALIKILTCVKRSAHLVQQLLTLNRISPEITLGGNVEINLETETAKIAAELVPQAIAKNIELELNVCPNPIMLGNTMAISILVRNLIDNAIRYSPKNTKISINLEESENQLIFSVVDHGPGIAAEFQERVFERFFRVTDNTATGSGLGLNIVSQIARIHHAQVTLKNNESGIGLTVQVIFTRCAASQTHTTY